MALATYKKEFEGGEIVNIKGNGSVEKDMPQHNMGKQEVCNATGCIRSGCKQKN